MAARLQLALAGVLALIAVALGGLLLFGKEGADSPDAFTVGPSGFAGSVAPADLPLRDFTLRDQDGHPVSLAAQRGRVTVVSFLYSTCQDTCPVTATQIKSALDRLPRHGSDVSALAVSVDPAQDTPALARKFLLARQLTGRMEFLLGTRPELQRVWTAYSIQPQGTAAQSRDDPDEFEHSTYVAVLDKRGVQRVSFHVDDLNPAALAHDIRVLQAESR